jgi:hypothetical protein
VRWLRPRSPVLPVHELNIFWQLSFSRHCLCVLRFHADANFGGSYWDRTSGLRIASAALSQAELTTHVGSRDRVTSYLSDSPATQSGDALTRVVMQNCEANAELRPNSFHTWWMSNIQKLPTTVTCGWFEFHCGWTFALGFQSFIPSCHLHRSSCRTGGDRCFIRMRCGPPD